MQYRFALNFGTLSMTYAYFSLFGSPKFDFLFRKDLNIFCITI